MNSKVTLILGASAHLPSGAGEAEFEALYNREIRPLIQALDKFPRINMVFHYSGVVLHWIERRHPELFMLIEDLLSRKQAEFLGGGFYAPVLPLLPLADKIGQIEMLTTYLRKQFGKRPQGCWIQSMAWEQNLVGPLNSCGMGYTFLEDQQFRGAGVKPGADGIFLPCITEDQGKLIIIFPIAAALGRELRTNAGEFMKKLPAGEYTVTVFPFRGEAGENWTEETFVNFFEGLSGADSGIDFGSPAKVSRNLHGMKKVFFPGVWAADYNAAEKHPRQFLADHPEACGIYAKMIHVHTLINNQLRGDKTRKRTALEELWKAQDAGIFRLGCSSSPGLLHSPVRKAAYRSLIEAEKITREKGKFSPSLSVFDFDLDGEGEYIFQDDKLNCFVKSRGAGIFELDYLPASWNYLDTLSLPNNPERRSAFVDWLAPADTNPLGIEPAGIPGGFFCGDREYEVSEIDRVRRRLSFTLRPGADSAWGEIAIEKTWQLKKNSLALEYVLTNSGTGAANFLFSPQLDLSFPGDAEDKLRILVQKEEGKESLAPDDTPVIRNIRSVEFQDLKNESVITLESGRVFDGRVFNIYTGTNEYQSTCFMPLFSVSLESGKTWKAVFSLKISS